MAHTARIVFSAFHGDAAYTSRTDLCMAHITVIRALRGGGGFSTGKFLPGKIECGKNSATIVKRDGKNCATLFHGEGQGLRSALLTEGDTTCGKGVMRV